MAQTGGDGPDQDLARPGCADLYVIDDEIAGDLFEHGSLHADTR